MTREIAAKGAVVEAPTEPSQQDAGDRQCDGYGPDVIHFGDGDEVAVEADVGIEQIHQRIVDGIERITQFAQEAAHTPCGSPYSELRSAQPHQAREDENDTQGIVQAVLPRHHIAKSKRQTSHHKNDDSTAPKGAMHPF